MVLSIKRCKFLDLFDRWKLYRVHKNGRKAIKVLIAVVIGALVLSFFYSLYNTTIMPNVTNKVNSMFSYSK